MVERPDFARTYNMMGDPHMWRLAAKYSAVGIQMAVSIVIGWFGGAYLDGKLGTKPYFAYILLGCGIAAGFLGLYRIARSYKRDSTEPPS